MTTSTMPVKLNARSLESQGEDRWYVTDGTNAVGPVRLELLVRGVESGRVPLDSFLRHEGWRVWKPLGEFALVEDGGDTGEHGRSVPTVRGVSRLTELVDEDTAIPATAASASDPIALESAPRAVEVPLHLPAAHAEAGSEPGPAGDVAPRASSARLREPSNQRASAPPRTPLGGERPGLDSMLDDEETILRAPSQPSGPPPAPSGVAPAPTASPARVSAPPPPRISAPPPPPRISAPPQVPPPPPRRSSQPPVLPAPSARISVLPPPSAPPAPPPAASVERVTALPVTVSAASAAALSVNEDFSGAQSLAEGLLWLLGWAVQAAGADGGLAHRVSDDGSIVTCARGPEVASALGMRTRLLDPALVAAAGGHVVIAEPVPGPAGEATHARMRTIGLEAEGALMIPVRPRERLVAFLELGSRARFSLSAIARLESLVKAFVQRCESAGWG